jgi:hypothetical protein
MVKFPCMHLVASVLAFLCIPGSEVSNHIKYRISAQSAVTKIDKRAVT